jgi:hypothetical protein
MESSSCPSKLYTRHLPGVQSFMRPSVGQVEIRTVKLPRPLTYQLPFII